MDIQNPILHLLDDGSERTAHHWVDIEEFHSQIMRHTSRQTFKKIIIFVSEDVLRELSSLWVDSDSRVSFIKEHQSLPGYEYSYRLMPVLTDCQQDKGRFLTQGKYVVAYYNDMKELPNVAMAWQAPEAIRRHQEAREQQEFEFDLETETFSTRQEGGHKFANAADMYYNGPVPMQQQQANAAAYYSNPREQASAEGGWDASDYGGPQDK